MRHDPKIKRVVRKYGADGYALYNYILESIAGNLNPKDPLPNLEETSEDIAYDLKLDTLRVQEIVGYCLEQGLFSQDEVTGHILCLKMYKFLDDATRKSSSVVNMLNSFAKLNQSDKVGQIPSESEKVLPDKDKDLDPDEELDKNIPSPPATPPPDPFEKFPAEVVAFVKAYQAYSEKEYGFITTVSIMKKCCDTVDKLIRLDNKPLDLIIEAMRWASVDDFWQGKVKSLSSLRKVSSNDAKKFDNILTAMERHSGGRSSQSTTLEHNRAVMQEWLNE